MTVSLQCAVHTEELPKGIKMNINYSPLCTLLFYHVQNLCVVDVNEKVVPIRHV